MEFRLNPIRGNEYICKANVSNIQFCFLIPQENVFSLESLFHLSCTSEDRIKQVN